MRGIINIYQEQIDRNFNQRSLIFQQDIEKISAGYT